MFELREYQKEGIEALAANPRFFLWDEPGMGKTVQLIHAADKVRAKRVLVVCPANIVHQWEMKIHELSRTKFESRVVSYNKLADSLTKYRAFKPDVVIIDEGHYLKNRKAKRTQAVYGPKSDGIGGVIEGAKYVWDSTGSPAPNNYSELWTKLRAMTPQVITMKSGKILDYWGFLDKFCLVRDNGFGPQIIGNQNGAVLKERLAPFNKRRLKRDHRNPPVIDTLVLEAKGTLAALRSAEQDEEGKLIARTLELHGVAGLERIGTAGASLRRLTGLAKVDVSVAQIIDEIEGGLKKLVVIGYHRDVIEGLQRGLEKAGIGCAVYYGGIGAARQEKAKETFMKNDKCQVFIGQITAAGTGTDGLQEVCKDILLVEYSWVPEENKQIIGRVDRLGGYDNVLARFVSLAGSLDERISASVARKTADIVALLG